MNLYSKKVMNHFKNSRNIGKIKNPDGIGKVGNFYCGDIMHLYIKVEKNKNGKEIIKDAKYETFGCVAAISTSSMITDLAKGKTLKEAMQIDKKNIVEALGGLPRIKLHCSVLAIDALSESIYDYLSKNSKKIPRLLLKKHEKIQKEREVFEKKYKDVGFQLDLKT